MAKRPTKESERAVTGSQKARRRVHQERPAASCRRGAGAPLETDTAMDRPIAVAIEAGTKRTFASAIAWPGWSRPGASEGAALAALVDYGPRYARVVAGVGLDFVVPARASDFLVAERLPGTATTDFGAPGVSPAADEAPLADAELTVQIRLLEAAWSAFDRAIEGAAGFALRTGPRGGGRDRVKMMTHVVEAEQAYVRSLGAPTPRLPPDLFEARGPLRAAAIDAMRARTRGDLTGLGERGGRRWTARYFVRRAAWHVLDHAWEIEDRSA